MKKNLLIVLAFCVSLLSVVAAQQQPLRVFIRAGEKTHGPGQHDHPKFLEEWKELLNQRGAKTDGSIVFPTTQQLENTDVLVMYAAEGGTIAPEERVRLDTFLKRGGGIVVIHDAICGKDPQYFKGIVGGAWEHGKSKYFEGDIALYYVDRSHPITTNASNFEFDDEMYYELHLAPEARVLAATYKPDERNNKGGKLMPSVYDIVPQMWTYEKDDYRAFVSIPGHEYKTFSLPHFRAILLRGIAWTGKREVDSLCSQEELASLRYPERGPTAPEKSDKQITVHDAFDLKLVAAEPLIEKPISHDWDAQGRLWVAETPEYPAGRKTGDGDKTEDRPARDRISILEDSNGDGVADKKSVFFEGLEMVTSFVFYRDGVVVAQPPDIYWLRDTNSDGKAETKQTLYTGFGVRDTHATLSNLRWGMDGWIYGTLGYSGGTVKGADGYDQGSFNSGVIRFRPDRSQMEQVSSKNGNTWGLDITWDGEIFFSQANGEHINHVVLSENVLAKGRIANATSYKAIEDHEKVFPIREYDKQAYVQIDHVGGFTAASGATIYDGGAWPAEWDNNFFVSEPTVNLIHRDLLKPSGPTFVASKDRETEFIASRDLWFRPVHHRVGPDGAFYILDFYNQAVVHNDTRGPKHGPNNAAVRPDRDHHFGRVWRVQSKQATKFEVPNLAKAAPAELVKALEHPNNWVRSTAHRLLVENPAAEAVPAIEKLLASTNSSPKARVHALWVLAKTGKITEENFLPIFDDADPGLRKNALRIGSELPHKNLFPPALMPKIIGGLQDSDSRVRLAAIVAMSYFPPVAKTAKEITDLYLKHNDPWTQSAIAACATRNAGMYLEEAFAFESPTGMETFVSFLTRTIASRQQVGEIPPVVIRASVAGETHNVLRIIALEELNKTLKPEVVLPWSPALQKLLLNLLGSTDYGVRGATLPLISRWDKTGAMSEDLKMTAANLLDNYVDGAAPEEQRLQSVRSLVGLRHLHPGIIRGIMMTFATNSPSFQKEIVTILATEVPEVSGELFSKYSELPPEAQEAFLNNSLKRAESAGALLDALAAKQIDLTTLGPLAISRLRTHLDEQIAQRANKIIDDLRGPEVKEKNQLIDKFGSIVELPGDIEIGKKLFTQNCAVCHRFKDEGKDLGPDLTGMGAHGARELLVHIVDPNRVVEPNFTTVSVETKNDEAHDGIVGRENKSTILLRNANGDVEINKKDIKRQKNTGRSLMPEGFEALGGEGLRDIIAYLGATEVIYRIIDIKPTFTANSTRGIYASQESTNETLKFKRFGIVKAGDIPFEIANPVTTPSGNNVVVLKGQQGLAKRMPQKVEIGGLNLTAHTLHVLGGVAGWGWPWGNGTNKNENLPAAKITVEYDNGKIDEFILKNGVEIADYNGNASVPGSKEVTGVVERGQVRMFSRPIKEFYKTKKITLESFDNILAPTFVALTVETAPRRRIVNTIDDLATFFPKSFGPVRVWMLGGGTSHEYDKWFRESDSVTLAYASDSPVEYRDRLDKFLEGANREMADVLYIASNQPLNDPVKKAIMDFANGGGGFLLIHPALWYNWTEWPEYNRQLVAGGARSHDKYGEFEVVISDRAHPIMENIPRSFTVKDELYHFKADPMGPAIQVLATAKSPTSGETFPVVWIVKHPKAKIVCITLGHDQGSHENLAFKVMLQNAMAWVAGKK